MNHTYLLVAFALIIPSATITYAQNDNLPAWIKSTAGLWADDSINDSQFFNLIQFLIDRNIITVPQTQNDSEFTKLEIELESLKKQSAKDIQDAYDNGYDDGYQIGMAGPLVMKDETTVKSKDDTHQDKTSNPPITKKEIPLAYEGSFIGVNDGIHNAKGNVYTIPLEDGGNVLRLENFFSTNGPDLFVYLSADKGASDFVNLGELKANRGNQNYDIPEGTDLEKYNKVLIWCKSFSILFGSAKLSSIPNEIMVEEQEITEIKLKSDDTSGTLSDGTMVSIWTSIPTIGKKMDISVDFTDARNVNHDLLVTQNDKQILHYKGVHISKGTGVYMTPPLRSSDPVEITVTFTGYGVGTAKTGPIGDLITFPNTAKAVTITDPSKVTIQTAIGSSTPGCEDTAIGCFIPSTVTVDVGGMVTMSNTDTVAHTFTAKTLDEDGVPWFDSSLLSPGNSYEWIPASAGERPYYCIVHPWMIGMILVR